MSRDVEMFTNHKYINFVLEG